MFKNIELSYVILPAVGIYAIAGLAFLLRAKNEENPLRKVAGLLTFNLAAFGLLVLLLWLALPSSSSFIGYPETVEDIRSPELLFKHLQKQNQALMRIIEVLIWFMFTFIMLFLQSFFIFYRTLTNVVIKAENRKPSEKSDLALPNVTP